MQGIGSLLVLLYAILMEIMMEAASNNINNENLIWLDMEMSGLLPDSDRILELAVVVTDAELNVLGESPVLVIHQTDAVLDGMDAWNKGCLLYTSRCV